MAAGSGALGEAADLKTVGRLWLIMGSILAIGLIAWGIKYFSHTQ
jgi:preprotein translocase subunit SecY